MQNRDVWNPLAYPRLARSYGRHLRSLAGQWRTMRAVSADWRRWLVRRLLIPIVPLRITLTTRSGVRYALGDDPVDDAIVMHLHGDGSALYFPRLTEEPDGVILDVGAHHGLYAIAALGHYPRCRVVAVEPDALACRHIEVNARLNDVGSRIDIVRAGLGSVDGRGWLVRDEHGSWASRTVAARPTAAHLGCEIELRTLASILAGREPALVKCNAEGAEFALVPQLIALDYRPSVIVLMVHPESGSAEHLVTLLAGAGYDVRDADEPPRGSRFHCFRPPGGGRRRMP